METSKKTSSKCGDVLNKGSSFLSFISILLIVALFLRMESINSKTKINELRISKVESRMEIVSPQTTEHKNEMEIPEGLRRRNKRNLPQTQSTPRISLQLLRQEIDRKLSQVCISNDKICHVGPPGPPGIPGALGYPGYKGEKGASGITGPQGSLGPVGAPGPSGKQGRQGPQGVKGDMGRVGPRGIPGIKGDVGSIGRPGEKGTNGLKGNMGNRGYTGLQGPKGECIVDLKISIYPVSQEVFINTPAVFYCWVDGQTSKQITWSKLGGALLSDTTVKDGALHINNVQRSHVGSYMCTANTGYGILRAISNLHLKEPPAFTNKPPSRVVVKRGSSLSLCCEVTGFPRPRIEWSRAQQSAYLSPYSQENGCLVVNTFKQNSDGDYVCRATNKFGLVETATTVIIVPFARGASCDRIQTENPGRKLDGIYYVNPSDTSAFAVYCDMTSDGQGWTLTARFSNNDTKNWMRDDGSWLYDQQFALGTTANPFINSDMVSPAFWLVKGSEFKITRSDDSSHTPLLQTTGNCLAGQTFRSKITSFGDFRNGKVWASNQCLGNCTVQYGGQYKSTDGFQQAECSGNIQSANTIGFWCDWSNGDGSVMMIGGGGSFCRRADHGIGITEQNAASFVEETYAGQTEYDFGHNAWTKYAQSQSYSLNLWIR